MSLMSNFTPIPRTLIDYIKDNNWSILEMCAGKGKNNKKLKKFNIDVISYDIVKHNDILYAPSGSIENNFPTRALLICSGVEVKKSIAKYLEGEPIYPVVILGGYARSIKLKSKTIALIEDSSNPNNITYLKQYDISEKKYSDDIKYQLDIRPSPNWMVKNGWTLSDSFLTPSGPSDWNLSFIFQIWIRL